MSTVKTMIPIHSRQSRDADAAQHNKLKGVRKQNDNFFDKYRPSAPTRAPKHAILREAIIAAIQDGYWRSGDRLPTESELTQLTPYSLGTVQRAVQGLVAAGYVTRRQGSGTFVAPPDRRIAGPWLFRFLNREGTEFAAMTTRVISRKKVNREGPQFEWLTLGDRTKQLLEIDRLVSADGCTIYNRYYLDPKRFPVLASMPLRELDGANFAGLIQATYGLPITHVARAVQCAPLPEPACRAMGLPAQSLGLIVEIAASAGDARPVFYQQLFVPALAGKLFISDSFHPWITGTQKP